MDLEARCEKLFLDKDYWKVIFLAEEALKNPGLPALEHAVALRWKGLAHYNMGNLAEAATNFQHGLVLAAADANEKATCHVNLAKLYSSIGNLREALEHARAYLVLLEANPGAPLRRWYGRLQFSRGEAYAFHDRLPEAEACYREAIAFYSGGEHCERAGVANHLHGMAHYHLSGVLIRLGRLGEARHSLGEAQRLVKEEVLIPFFLNRQAQWHLARGEVEQARDTVLAAASHPLAEDAGMCEVLLTWAKLERYHGNFTGAARYCREALALADRARLPRIQFEGGRFLQTLPGEGAPPPLLVQ